MKKIYLLIILSFPILCYAQFKGSKFVAPYGGISINDNIRPTGGIGIGYLFSEKVQLDFSFRYNSFENNDMKGDFISLAPYAFYKVYNNRRFAFLVGMGAIGAYQKLSNKNELTEITTPSKFVFGGGISPRCELLVTSDLSLFADYRFEYQYNSIQKSNQFINLGIMYFF